jgi:hypothetical protein
MADTVKEFDWQSPESYSPKKPDILNLTRQDAIITNNLVDPFAGGEPPRTSNKITGIRQIQAWENFFLDAALDSLAKSLGEVFDDGVKFFSAITGDMFTYLYNKKKPCDSGVTNYLFVPRVVIRSFEAIGYECIYISNPQIKANFRTVMNIIKASIDKGVPVLAWGMGNVTLSDGSRYDPLPEGCIIGGYDEGDILYVNLYPDGLPADENDYCTITNGLATTYGIFVAGERRDKPDMKNIYRDAVNMIPVFLTLPPTDGYTFGKQAFYEWADTLLDDSYFTGKTEQELAQIRWDLHCTAYCTPCTSLGRVNDYIRKTIELNPDFEIAKTILPLYDRLKSYNDRIWELQGGFEPPLDRFKEHEYRSLIADILRQMGDTCDEIVAAFGKQ